MSDTSQGPGWWQASDGKWYPPIDDAPGPGWWLASDGKWYPPTATSGGTETSASERSSPAGKSRSAAPKPPAKRPPTKRPPTKAAAGKSGAATTRKPATKKPAAKKPSTRSTTAKPATTGRSGSKSRTASGKTATDKTAARTATGTPAAGTPAPRRPVPANPNEGMSPWEQIERRNAASRADAAALADRRFVAATRALGTLQEQIERELATQAAEPRLPAGGGPAKAGATGKANRAGPTTPPAKKADAVPASVSPAASGPKSTTEPAAPPAAKAEGPDAAPLLEVKPSALSTDLEHLGDRLAIFNDRVELRDRHDNVRQSVKGDEITDVVVHRRLTGVVLSIEGVDGPIIVAKGLRPEQAEESRLLILKKTRPKGPVTRAARPDPGPTTSTACPPAAPAAPRAPVNEAELLRKLGDLHRAGILTVEEYQDKIELVGRLVRGEDLTVTPT